MRSFISSKNFKYYILYIFIYSLIFLPIFLNKGVPVGNDWSVPAYPYHLQNWFKNNIYSWADESNFLGERVAFNTALLFQGAGYLLSYLFNMSGTLYFKLLLLTSFCIGGISAFNLLNRYGFNKWGSFIGGLIFTLNPVTFDFLLMGWNFVLLSVFLVPLFILFLDRYINTKKPAYLLFCTVVYAVSFVESQSIFYYPIIFLIYLLCRLRHLTIKNLLSIFKSLMVLIILAFLLHSFWLLSLIFYKDPIISSTVAEADILRFAFRTSFLNMIRGWGAVFNYQFETAYLKRLLVFSFTLPVIFVLSLLKKRRFKTNIVFFYCALFFFPLFFYSINKYLYFIPYTNTLRDFNRSFPYLFLAYAYFVARFFSPLSRLKTFSRQILQLFLFFCILLSLHPFIFGYLYSARENIVGISDKEVDQRLRLYQPEEDIKNFDLSINKKVLVLNEKALLLPTGGTYIYPDNKKFNGMWASILENNMFYSNFIKGIFLTGKSEIMRLLSSKIAEPFESEVECYLLTQPFLHSFLASNFNYIMVKNKVINTYKDIRSEQVKSCLGEYSDLFKPIFNSEGISIYEISSNHFLPHFYIPQNIIYSDGDIEILPDIVSLEDYPIRSGEYLSGIADKANEELIPLIGRADEIFVMGELESKVNEEGLNEVFALDEGDVFFPYVRWKPGGLVYPLILKKEQFDEWKVKKDQEKLLDRKLFYANKRISEVEKWGKEIDLGRAFERYKEKMEEAMELLKEDSRWEKGLLQKNILKTEIFLEAQWEKIITIELEEKEIEEVKDIFEELKEKVKDLKTKYDLSKLDYNFRVSKEGTYQLLIKNEEFSRYLRDPQLVVNILGEKTTIPFPSENEEWISGGSFKLERGEKELSLTKPQTINLLGTDNWRDNLTESIFVKNKMITADNLQLAFTEDSTLYFKPIENYQGNTLYKIAFDYFAFGGEAKISVIEDVGIKRRELKIKEELFRTSIDLPRHFEKIFQSRAGAKTAEFYFWGKTEEDEESQIKLFNVKIERVFEPTIILRSTNFQSPITNHQLPRITFIKINPTKYKIKVEGAKEPYTLVFSESFHKGWKAYVNNTPILQNSNAPNIYEEIVASYFDGEIKEGTHQNIFLNRNTFETWSKKPIPEDRHYLVNGYANSWYITPEDAGGEENYEIVIEFWPQRLFYVGLGVSLITLLGCLGYLGSSFVKNKTKG